MATDTLNEDASNRVTTQPASPLSIVSTSCLSACSWSKNTALGSDHLIIRIKIQKEGLKNVSEKKTFINFTKADWSPFTQLTEELFYGVNFSKDVLKCRLGDVRDNLRKEDPAANNVRIRR